MLSFSKEKTSLEEVDIVAIDIPLSDSSHLNKGAFSFEAQVRVHFKSKKTKETWKQVKLPKSTDINDELFFF